MVKRSYKPEETVSKLRQVDVLHSQGQGMTIVEGDACYRYIFLFHVYSIIVLRSRPSSVHPNWIVVIIGVSI